MPCNIYVLWNWILIDCAQIFSNEKEMPKSFNPQRTWGLNTCLYIYTTIFDPHSSRRRLTCLSWNEAFLGGHVTSRIRVRVRICFILIRRLVRVTLIPHHTNRSINCSLKDANQFVGPPLRRVNHKHLSDKFKTLKYPTWGPLRVWTHLLGLHTYVLVKNIAITINHSSSAIFKPTRHEFKIQRTGALECKYSHNTLLGVGGHFWA